MGFPSMLLEGNNLRARVPRTTFLWSCFWLNEREVARRPWLHRKSDVKIDQLLREEVPALFAHRKLESEYAVYLAA
jgi:hypothetical protein